MEWDPPIPIPGLSRTARLWLERSATRPIPAAVAQQVYAERAARIRDFVSSADFSALLGAEPTRDRLDAIPGDPRRAVLAFEQRYPQVPGDAALVRGARVSVHFGANAASIRSVLSTFQPDLEPPDVEVAPQEAIDAALAKATELGTVRAIAADDPVPLVVLRNPAFFGGARRSSEVRRANDRVAYAVRLVADDAVHRELVEVVVDAVTGEPVTAIPLSSGSFSVSLMPIPFVGPIVSDSFLEAIICGAWEGQGLDTDLALRRFSTTFNPSEPAPFAMVSCNEPAFSRMIKAKDVVTFNGTKPFADDDDVWIGPEPMRHAVNDQYWGERALRFFKKNGYLTREGSAQPVRFVAWQRVGMAEQAEFTKIQTPFGDENGVIEVGVGGPHFKTSADPMVLAHELGHSVWTDVLPYPADKTDEKAIFEGLADCFAMAAMDDMEREWDQDPVNNPPHVGYTEPALADRAPFSFWAGSYADDAHLTTPGYPNLWDPKVSWPLQWPPGVFDRFTRWSGRRSTFVRYEEDSTLVGAVCRMLVTGGPSVVGASARAVTAGGNFSDALAFSGTGVNRQVGFERLTRLQLFTLLEAKNHPASFHDLIDILAANAQTLASTEWGVGFQSYEEKVKRAFGEYGFGRGLENESLGNTPAKLNSLGTAAAANLIAAGSNFHRPIAGNLCSNDEDFFVVNEEAGVGDTINFTAQRTSGTGDLEVRFFRHKACSFTDKDCSKSYQVSPPVGADGSSPETAPTTGDFTFTGSGGGDCPPGAPCGGTYWKLFAGVRMKPGGSCNSGYTLTVRYKERAPGNKGVE